MGLIATKSREQSTILAYEDKPDLGVCRSEILMDNSADNLKIGSVLLSTDKGVTFTKINSSQFDTEGEVDTLLTSAISDQNQVAIVIDPKAGVGTLTSTGTDDPVLCIVRGTCGVKKEALDYLGTINDANNVLLARLIEGLAHLVRVEDSQVLIESFTDFGA